MEGVFPSTKIYYCNYHVSIYENVLSKDSLGILFAKKTKNKTRICT